MSETSAGSIIGTLRLSITDFETNIAKAQELADRLDGKNVVVDVKVDSAGAETKLAAVAASEDKVDAGNKKVASSSKDAGKGMGLLSMAIVGLGPAIVPLAAGAAGLAVGFGAMGAAGILAIVGISQQMKAGTPLGGAYTAMVGTLKGDLTTLGATAAAGVLAPFQKEVATLQGQMPALNSIIGEFSVITGKTAGNLMAGLVAAFIALEPLARDVGVYVLDLSAKFATLMSGSGVTAFGDYIRSVFPQVMQTVESVVGAAIRLVAALAPLGLGTLGILRTFTDLINAIPVDVLAVLAQGAVSVYLGFKTFSLLSVGIAAVGTALKTVGVSAETAAVGMRALNIAAGAIGVLITVASLAFSASAESTRQASQAANDYADALRASNGVIDESIRQQSLKSLSDSGALAAARELGYSLKDVAAAALQDLDAQARLDAHTKVLKQGLIDAASGGGDFTGAMADLTKQTDLVTGATRGASGELSAGTQKYKDMAAASATSAVATTAASVAQQKVATAAGTTVGALAAATTAQQATRDAAAQAAAKMYEENDAAGILKTGLDLLNGKAISAAQAQNAFDSSLVNLGDHVDQTGKVITFTTTSIKDMSSASVMLRGQLNSQVTNLQNVVEANGGLSESTGKARAQMVAMRQQIIDNAVAHGVDRAAVTAYIDKILTVPKSVPPTQLDVDKAAAEAKIVTFQKQIDAIKQGKVPGIDANSAAGRAVIAALQLGIDRIKQGKPPGVTADITPGQAQILAYQKQIDAIKQKLATGLDANPKAAELQITEMQKRIDEIKQGLIPGLDANSAAGKATIKDMQNKIDAIKQGNMPGIDANTGAGRQKIQELQAVINGLNGKTVQVVIQYTANGVNLTTPSSVGRSATGGPIVGAGTGTSDSILRLVSNGEHMLTADDVTAAGGHGAVMDWRKSLHGYAKGGPIVIGMPSGAAINAGLNTGASNGATHFDVSSILPTGGGGGGAGGAAQWAPLVLQVLAMMGQSAALLPGVLRLINKESSGNPNSINTWDINAKMGTPSMGLIQTILPTFLAYAGPFAALGPYNPLANLYAGLHRAIAAWGSIAAVDPLVHAGGYDTGGMMPSGGVGKNYGTKAERWLSGTQTEWFEAGRAAAGGTGGGADMSGVQAALAEQTSILRSLVPGFSAALNDQTTRQQTMQRQMARA